MQPRASTILSLALTLGGVAMLGGAFAFQHLGGLQPCVLCIWQRWPWAIAIALGLLALAARRNAAAQRWLISLGGATLLAGAGIAGFHVGVEQGWWEGTAACGGAVPASSGSITDLTQQLLATPVVACDQVAWSLFGLSMAGYNGLISLALGVVLLVAALRANRSAAYVAA